MLRYIVQVTRMKHGCQVMIMAIMVVMVVLAMIANKKVTATGVANIAKTRVMAMTRRCR